jgi:glucose/arabinose dehydrogenase/mono/diheme cytochrome c family protein
MNKVNACILLMAGYILFFLSCSSGPSVPVNDISADSVAIAKGEITFNQLCGGCHGFRQDGIGPSLAGITTSASTQWIQQFIKDAKGMMESSDERAKHLAKKYKAVMPSFSTLGDIDIQNIIAFLNTHQKTEKTIPHNDAQALTNPIPEAVKLSNLRVNLTLITQVPASSDSGRMPLARITKLDYERHSGNSFILDLRGKLYKLKNNKAAVYMDMAKLRPKFIPEPRLATGFGSFSFHPRFGKNGLLYTTHTESAGSGKADFAFPDSIKVALQCVVTEWKAERPSAATFSGTGRELFRVDMVTGMHGIQEIAFNPLSKAGDEDYGLLYICIGDGASVEEGYPFLAHSREKIWGTILCIDPQGKNSANGKYGIPATNPFAKDTSNKLLKEIYAYGFRNPHRISWNKSGDMLACNIGQGNIEAIDLVTPGRDYGWPIREGSFAIDPAGDLNKVHPLPPNDSAYKITYPVAQYDHDEGIAISGGFEYGGNTIKALKGKYLFGDIPSGRLFYINTADIKQGQQAPVLEWKISMKGLPTTLLKLCGGDRADLHFGKDARGDLYIMTKADGKLYQLTSATE